MLENGRDGSGRSARNEKASTAKLEGGTFVSCVVSRGLNVTARKPAAPKAAPKGKD